MKLSAPLSCFTGQVLVFISLRVTAWTKYTNPFTKEWTAAVLLALHGRWNRAEAG